jgi:hypothetical protein
VTVVGGWGDERKRRWGGMVERKGVMEGGKKENEGLEDI